MRQIVIIDDNADVLSTIQDFASLKDWAVFADDGRQEPPYIPPRRETLVLLDRIPKADQWLARFHRRNPDLKAQIYLVTGQDLSEGNAFVAQHHLHGLLQKPWSLSALEGLFCEKSPVSSPTLDEALKTLQFSIRIIDPNTLEIVNANQQAEDCPLTPSERKSVHRMVRKLTQSIRKNERKDTVSFGLRNTKLVCQVLLQSNEGFILLEEGFNPAKFERETHWKTHLTQFSEFLRDEWSITRVRYYQANQLYVPVQPISTPSYLVQCKTRQR